MSEQLLYNTTEAAKALSISRSKVYQLIAAGRIPSVRVGGSVRVPVDKLRAWIDAQARADRPEA